MNNNNEDKSIRDHYSAYFNHITIIIYNYNIQTKITNTLNSYNVHTKITNVFTTIKKQPKWLLVIEITIAVLGLLGWDSSSYDFTPEETMESEYQNYDTIPVWVKKTGPFRTDEFEGGGGSITWDLGNTKMMHLPTKDGINIIVPEDLEFDTITKIDEPYIEFDQKSYSWTEKIYVTIIDPWRNQDSNYVERLGSFNDKDIKISTKSGNSLDYVFEESEKDTGIFLAEIILTGFDSFDVNNDNNANDAIGATFGQGPRNGLIGTAYADELVVSYHVSPDKIITSSVPIEMVIGEINIFSISESPNTFGIRLIDPDLNLNPYEDDFVMVRVTSKSDPQGVEVKLIETRFGAFFEKIIETSFDSLDETKLFANPGDVLTVIYYDKTLPQPYDVGDVLEITDTRIVN